MGAKADLKQFPTGHISTGFLKKEALLEAMPVRHEYIPFTRQPTHFYGFSEEQVKRRLRRDGWIVWRGGSLNIIRQDEVYPNVKNKYGLLQQLMEQDFPDRFELLQYWCEVHHGMPDYLCFRSKGGKREWKFVECKLNYEQLSARQKVCIGKLQDMGFAVEVHKLVDHRTKARSAEVDLEKKVRRIRERQTTLRGRGKIKLK
jgi:hypothetical protein